MEYLFKALEAAIESAAESRQGGPPGSPPPGRPAEASQREKKRRTVQRAAFEPAPEPPGHPHDAPPPSLDGGLVPLFEDGKSLIRALVAAEVLGPPIALREPSTWSQRPNEPSI